MPYLIRPKADDDWWSNGPLIHNVTVDERKEVDTGLVTDKGQKIYRVPPPIGFGRDEEW